MHTKINTHQNDPNFLTHAIWSKTSLGVQHIHLELLWKLSYVYSNKIKHNSRINISSDYKIVINSPEVCLWITRQYENVGCKNLNMFSYKNHFWRICKMENNFYKKIYIITFCNFLAQEPVMTQHTTYPKIGYIGFMEFKILQILVFHIPIFHAKTIRN
jgi:hypothetical protein